MKILFYTDNHFCQYSSILRSRGEKYSVRLENQIETMNWLAEQSEAFDVDLEVCGGDFFDKNTLDAESITALNDIIWSDKPKIFIVGNHELSTADTSLNSLNVLAQKGFQIISNPQIISLSNIDLYFLPYDNTLDKISDLIEPTCDRRIFFSHNDIKGINYGGFETKTGIDIDDINANCDLFINGHLHNYSKYGKVINVGNITGQNFSEDALKYTHYAIIIDTDTLEIKYLENPYALKFYKLDFTIPEHNDIDYINSVPVGHNAVISLKLHKGHGYECIRTRFDKHYEYKGFPKHCGVIESRCIIVPEESTETNASTVSVDDLHIDHLKQFNTYILNQLGTSNIVAEELSEICK